MNTNNTSSIPNWNLDSLFSGLESPEYKKALAEYTTSMNEIDALLETADKSIQEADNKFDFAEWLSTFLEADNKCAALESTLSGYAYIIYSTDTTNTAYLNNISHIEELSLRSQQQSIKFSTLLASQQKQLPEFYKRFSKYADYTYLINEIIKEKMHQMSPAEENLATDLQRTGGDAWSRLHEQIISNLHDETGKTFNELRNDAYASDAKLRKNSWQKEVSLLKQNEIAFSASLNNLKGETVTLNKRRHWDEAVDRALFSSRMSKETLNALIGAIEDSLPLWREYLQTKAQLLQKAHATASKTAGTPQHKGLAFYDLFAPLCKTQTLLQRKTVRSKRKNLLLLTQKNGLLQKQKTIFSKSTIHSCKDMANFAEYAICTQLDRCQSTCWKSWWRHMTKILQSVIRAEFLSNFTGAFNDIVH